MPLRATLTVDARRMLALPVVLALGLQLGPGPVSSLSRRGVITQAAAAALAAQPLVTALPAMAEVRGANANMPKSEKDVNRFLASAGFPPMAVPSGCSPLVEYIGTAPPANIDGMKTRQVQLMGDPPPGGKAQVEHGLGAEPGVRVV